MHGWTRPTRWRNAFSGAPAGPWAMSLAWLTVRLLRRCSTPTWCTPSARRCPIAGPTWSGSKRDRALPACYAKRSRSCGCFRGSFQPSCASRARSSFQEAHVIDPEVERRLLGIDVELQREQRARVERHDLAKSFLPELAPSHALLLPIAGDRDERAVAVVT